MWTWLRHLFAPRPRALPAPALAELVAAEVVRALAAREAPVAAPAAPAPPELAELLDATRKGARALAKLGARAEAAEAALADISARVVTNDVRFWEPAFDALDALDLAIEALERGHTDGAIEGLGGIRARMVTLLGAAGYARHGALGAPVDGRVQRVVGVEERAGIDAGRVARVVRAAVTRGEQVVRTGEVIAARSVHEHG